MIAHTMILNRPIKLGIYAPLSVISANVKLALRCEVDIVREDERAESSERLSGEEVGLAALFHHQFMFPSIA